MVKLLSKFLSKNRPATDPEQHFRTDHLKTDLRGRSVRGGTATMVTQGCKFVLQIGSTVALARLLTPQDYGLVGMVTVVTNFVSMFKDMGLSMATIQVPEINHRQISTLFWINVAISIAVVLLTVAIAPVIAWFYSEPRLVLITIVLASGIFFSGLGVQHGALLKRQMRFTALAAIDITSMLVSVAAAMVLAWYGFGYWALVFMTLALTIMTSLGVWVMCGWRPGSPVRHSGVRSMLAFGGNLTGFNILNYFVLNLDNVLIGRFWGAQQLGLYAKGYQLLLLPTQQINAPISNVVIPALSRLQLDPDQYRNYYLKAILLVTTFSMPIVAFLFVVADKAILTVLGEQWVDVVPIFRLLAPAAFVWTTYAATTWVYVSLGQTYRQFLLAVVVAPITVLGFIIGVRWGAIGVAAAYSITVCILRYPTIVYCFKSTPLKVIDLIGVLWKPALASVMSGAVLFAFNTLFTTGGDLAIGLLLDFGFYVLLYILSWSILPNGRQLMSEILSLVKDLRRKKEK
jgi:O-antigen/teichoic acid export membrane protein